LISNDITTPLQIYPTKSHALPIKIFNRCLFKSESCLGVAFRRESHGTNVGVAFRRESNRGSLGVAFRRESMGAFLVTKRFKLSRLPRLSVSFPYIFLFATSSRRTGVCSSELSMSITLTGWRFLGELE
jgi:hypothetical protein